MVPLPSIQRDCKWHEKVIRHGDEAFRDLCGRLECTDHGMTWYFWANADMIDECHVPLALHRHDHHNRNNEHELENIAIRPHEGDWGDDDYMKGLHFPHDMEHTDHIHLHDHLADPHGVHLADHVDHIAANHEVHHELHHNIHHEIHRQVENIPVTVNVHHIHESAPVHHFEHHAAFGLGGMGSSGYVAYDGAGHGYDIWNGMKKNTIKDSDKKI